MEEDARGDVPPWLDLDDIEPPTRPPAERARRLAVLAGVPWALAAVVLWARPGDPPAGPEVSAASTPAPAPGARAASPTPEASPTDVATAPDPGTTATLTTSGGWTAVGQDEARAVAVVVARRWLTTVGPADDDDADAAPDGDGRYAEHLVVEGIDHPAPGAAVVTVRGVVLSVAGDGYDAVEVVRLAVPLRFDADGARPAGDPYLLPVEEAAPAPLDELEAIEDVDVLLVAAEALAAAGYREIDLRSLHRTDGWPLVATADVRVAPDAPRQRIVVWLRQHLGRFVVAGTRPRAPRPPGHATDPDGSPSTPSTPHDHHEEGTP